MRMNWCRWIRGIPLFKHWDDLGRSQKRPDICWEDWYIDTGKHIYSIYIYIYYILYIYIYRHLFITPPKSSISSLNDISWGESGNPWESIDWAGRNSLNSLGTWDVKNQTKNTKAIQIGLTLFNDKTCDLRIFEIIILLPNSSLRTGCCEAILQPFCSLKWLSIKAHPASCLLKQPNCHKNFGYAAY